ncbi:MAG TPA: DUF924 family protein [Caulobacteraceae bacterium]
MNSRPADIVDFWQNAGRAKWFAKDPAFDEAVRTRFEALHHAAARGEHESWAASPQGSLALVLLLDQVPRNLWRGSAHAFATDPLARRVADLAIARDHDKETKLDLRAFFYLPFAHSESAADQARSVALSSALAAETGNEGDLRSAIEHSQIVERFGRFPHRNRCLGRQTTPEEQAFLDAGGFAG